VAVWRLSLLLKIDRPFSSRLGLFLGVVFCMLFIQRGRETCFTQRGRVPQALCAALGDATAEAPPAVAPPAGWLGGTGEGVAVRDISPLDSITHTTRSEAPVVAGTGYDVYGVQVRDVSPPADPVAALLAGAARSVTLHPSGRMSADCPFTGMPATRTTHCESLAVGGTGCSANANLVRRRRARRQL
jgi:hypothetical protein